MPRGRIGRDMGVSVAVLIWIPREEIAVASEVQELAFKQRKKGKILALVRD